MALNKSLEEEEESSKPANQDKPHTNKSNISNDKMSTAGTKTPASKEERGKSNDSNTKTFSPKSVVFGFDLEDVMQNLDSSSLKTNFCEKNNKISITSKASDLQTKFENMIQKGNAKTFYMGAFKRFLFHLRHAFSNVPPTSLLDLHENKKWDEFFNSIENEEDFKPIVAYLSTNELKVVKCLIDSCHLPKQDDNGISKAVCLLRKKICEECSAKEVKCEPHKATINENTERSRTKDPKFKAKIDFSISKNVQEFMCKCDETKTLDDKDLNHFDESEICFSEKEEIVVEYIKHFRKTEQMTDEKVKEEIDQFLERYKDRKNNLKIFDSLHDIANNYFVQLKKTVNNEFNTLRHLNIIMESIKNFKENFLSDDKNEDYSGWVIEDFTMNSDPKLQVYKISKLPQQAARKVKKQPSKVHNKIGKCRSKNPNLSSSSKTRKEKISRQESNKFLAHSKDKILDASTKRYINVCQNIASLNQTYGPIFASQKKQNEIHTSEMSPTSKSGDISTSTQISEAESGLLSSLAKNKKFSEEDKNNNQEQENICRNCSNFNDSKQILPQKQCINCPDKLENHKSSETLEHRNHKTDLRTELKSSNVTDDVKFDIQKEVLLKSQYEDRKNSSIQEVGLNCDSRSEVIYEFTGNKTVTTTQMGSNSNRQNLKNSPEGDGSTNQVRNETECNTGTSVTVTNKSQKITKSEMALKFSPKKHSDPTELISQEKDNAVNKTVIQVEWQNPVLDRSDKSDSVTEQNDSSGNNFQDKNKTESVSKNQVPKPIEGSKQSSSPLRKKPKLQMKTPKPNNWKKSGITPNMQREAKEPCLLQKQSGEFTCGEDSQSANYSNKLNSLDERQEPETLAREDSRFDKPPLESQTSSSGVSSITDLSSNLSLRKSKKFKTSKKSSKQDNSQTSGISSTPESPQASSIGSNESTSSLDSSKSTYSIDFTEINDSSNEPSNLLKVIALTMHLVDTKEKLKYDTKETKRKTNIDEDKSQKDKTEGFVQQGDSISSRESNVEHEKPIVPNLDSFTVSQEKCSTQVGAKSKDSQMLEETNKFATEKIKNVYKDEQISTQGSQDDKLIATDLNSLTKTNEELSKKTDESILVSPKQILNKESEVLEKTSQTKLDRKKNKKRKTSNESNALEMVSKPVEENLSEDKVLHEIQPKLDAEISSEATNDVLDANVLVTIQNEDKKVNIENGLQQVLKKRNKTKKAQLIYSNMKPQQFYNSISSGSSNILIENNPKADTAQSNEVSNNLDKSNKNNSRNKTAKVSRSEENQHENKINNHGTKVVDSFIKKERLLDFGMKLHDMDLQKRNKRNNDLKLFRDVTLVDVKLGSPVLKSNDKNGEHNVKGSKQSEASKYAVAAGKALQSFMNIAEDFPKCEETMIKRRRSTSIGHTSKSKNCDKTRTSPNLDDHKKEARNGFENSTSETETENNLISNNNVDVRSTELKKNTELKNDEVVEAELVLVNINGCPTSVEIFENLPSEERSDGIPKPKHVVTELDNLENQELEIFVESNKGKTVIKTLPSEPAESSKTFRSQIEDNSRTPHTSISDIKNFNTPQSKRSKRRKSKGFKQESKAEKKSTAKNIVTSGMKSDKLKNDPDDKQLKVLKEEKQGVEKREKSNRSFVEDVPTPGVCPDIITQEFKTTLECPINISVDDLKFEHEEEIVDIVKQENKVHRQDLPSTKNESQADCNPLGTNIEHSKIISEEGDILKLKEVKPVMQILQRNTKPLADHISSNSNHSEVDSKPLETDEENRRIVFQGDNNLKVVKGRQENNSFIDLPTACNSQVESKSLKTNSEPPKITPEESEDLLLKDEKPVIKRIQQDNKSFGEKLPSTTNNSQVDCRPLETIVEQSKNDPVTEKLLTDQLLKQDDQSSVKDLLSASNYSQVKSKHLENNLEFQTNIHLEDEAQKSSQRKRKTNRKKKTNKSPVGDVPTSTQNPEKVTKKLIISTEDQTCIPMGNKKIKLEKQEESTEIIKQSNSCPDIFSHKKPLGDVTKTLDKNSESQINKSKKIKLEKGKQICEANKNNKSPTIDICSMKNSELKNTILEVKEEDMLPVLGINSKQQKEIPKEKEVTVREEPQASKTSQERDASVLRGTFQLGNHPKFIANLLKSTSKPQKSNPEEVNLMQVEQEEPNPKITKEKSKTKITAAESKLLTLKQNVQSQEKIGESKIKKSVKRMNPETKNFPDNGEVTRKDNKLGEDLEKILDIIAETCQQQLNGNKFTDSKASVQNQGAKSSKQQLGEKLNVFKEKTKQGSSEFPQGFEEMGQLGRENIDETCGLTVDDILKLKETQGASMNTYSSIDDAVAHPKVNTYKISDVKQTEDLYEVDDSKSLEINLKAKVQDEQEMLPVNQDKVVGLPIEVQESLKTLARYYMNNYTNSLTTADFFLNNSRLQILIVSKTNELDSVEEMEVDECLPSNVQENVGLANNADIEKIGSGESDMIPKPGNQEEHPQKASGEDINLEKPFFMPTSKPETSKEVATLENSSDVDTKQQSRNKTKHPKPASGENINSSDSTITPPFITSKCSDTDFEKPSQPSKNDSVNKQELAKSLEGNINAHLLNEIHDIKELKKSLNNPSVKAMLHVMDAIRSGLDKSSNKSDNDDVHPQKHHEAYRVTKDGLVNLINTSDQNQPSQKIRILKRHENIPEEESLGEFDAANKKQDLENGANIVKREEKGEEYIQGQGHVKERKTQTQGLRENNIPSSGTKSQQKSNKWSNTDKSKKRKLDKRRKTR